MHKSCRATASPAWRSACTGEAFAHDADAASCNTLAPALTSESPNALHCPCKQVGDTMRSVCESGGRRAKPVGSSVHRSLSLQLLADARQSHPLTGHSVHQSVPT